MDLVLGHYHYESILVLSDLANVYHLMGQYENEK